VPSCNLSLQVVPQVEEEKLYSLVDQVIELIKASGVKHKVGPMETTMEGELEELLEIVKQAQHLCSKNGADRIISVIKIDYSSKGVAMDEKMEKYQD